jgi:CheY-like chemotaxis protein
MVSLLEGAKLPLVPNVVVVDPDFQAYGPLVAAARAGRLNLHLRATGAEAIKLARRLEIDAWLVSSDLDDMAGADFIEILDTLPSRGSHSVAMIASAESAKAELVASETLQHPITMDSIESLLREASPQVPGTTVGGRSRMRTLLTLPVGVGAALVAIAALMIR